MEEIQRAENSPGTSEEEGSGIDRKHFLSLTVGAATCVAGAASLAPFIKSMSPSQDIEAQRTVNAFIDDIPPGGIKTVEWQGRAVFIVHRTPEMIAAAQAPTTIQPEDDKDRVKKPEWLILDGTCQHLGCIPLWEPDDKQGWICRCHGSRYDLSGRAIKGPTPANLLVPPYSFISDKEIMLGEPAKGVAAAKERGVAEGAGQSS